MARHVRAAALVDLDPPAFGRDPDVVEPDPLRVAAAADADAVVPVTEGGDEPLFAVYRRSAVLPAAEAVLAGGGRRIADIFGRVRLCRMRLPDASWLRNLNTPEDYHQFL